MIHITKDQNVAENPNLRVATSTGDYDDFAHIEVYDISNPDIVSCSFQAQYVVYGGLVYKYNTHQELGVEILKIDPESTHTAASYVRMSNQLLEQMNQGSLEVDSLDQVITSEQSKVEDKIIENIEEVPEQEILGDTQEEVVSEPDVPTSDTTPVEESQTLPPAQSDDSEVDLPSDIPQVDTEEIVPAESNTISVRRTKKKIA